MFTDPALSSISPIDLLQFECFDDNYSTWGISGNEWISLSATPKVSIVPGINNNAFRTDAITTFDELLNLRYAYSGDPVGLSGVFSLWFWFRPNSTLVGINMQISNGTPSAFLHDAALISYSSFSDFFQFTVSQSDATLINASTTGIIQDVWHLAVCTADGVNVNLYLDGSLVDSTPYDGTVRTDNNQFINIRAGGNDQPGYIDIDEFGYDHAALSPSVVTAMWNGGSGEFVECLDSSSSSS